MLSWSYASFGWGWICYLEWSFGWVCYLKVCYLQLTIAGRYTVPHWFLLHGWNMLLLVVRRSAPSAPLFCLLNLISFNFCGVGTSFTRITQLSGFYQPVLPVYYFTRCTWPLMLFSMMKVAYICSASPLFQRWKSNISACTWALYG